MTLYLFSFDFTIMMHQDTPRRNPLDTAGVELSPQDSANFCGTEKVVDHPNSSRKFAKVKLLSNPDQVSTQDWEPSMGNVSNHEVKNAQRHEHLPEYSDRIFGSPSGEALSEHGLSIGGGGTRKLFATQKEEMVMHEVNAVGENPYRFTRKVIERPPTVDIEIPIGKRQVKTSVDANRRTICTEETPEELQESLRMRARYDQSRRIQSNPNFITPSNEINYSDPAFHSKPVQIGSFGRYEHTPSPSLETLQGVLTQCDDKRVRPPRRPAPFGLETDT